MKNIKLNSIIIILLCLTVSCSNEKDESNGELNEEGTEVGLVIDKVVPLPEYLSLHTIRIANNVKHNELSPNIGKSLIVSFKDSPIRAIYTPLKGKLKSSIETFHVYFEFDGKVSKFDLLISEEDLSESEKRFTYLTIEGELIAQFNVGIKDGRISNIITNHLKSWGERFENCVEWTFNQMSGWERLGCVAFGPYCAGTIAAMCGVGASEGMFETPDGP